jgi:hypothetical protein
MDDGFEDGDLLATVGLDRAAQWCFVFGGVHSPMASQRICRP